MLEFWDSHIADWLLDKGITGIVFILFFSAIKAIGTSLYNIFASKKIAEDIQRSRKVKSIIQRAEKSRLLMRADRVIVTQLHNGSKTATGSHHLYKISLMQELSIDDPDGLYRTKIFDNQLKDLPISQLDPILSLVTARDYDIISVKELKTMGFQFYRHLKLDKVSYIILAKIQHKEITMGYIFLLFIGDNIPEHNRDNLRKLIELGLQIGDVLK